MKSPNPIPRLKISLTNLALLTIGKAIIAMRSPRSNGLSLKIPDDTEATQLTGLSLYLSNKPAEAIPYLVKVQSWYPSASVDASYILGVAYIQTKDYASARRAFAKMFQVAPDSAAAYLFTARLLLRLDFAPVAEEYGKKAIELDAKLPLAHQVLGELYLYENKLPEATAQFEQETRH